jgi:predicted kinase
MQTTLILFSGLPGTGKSTLSDRLARELRLPILRIDDIVGGFPQSMRTYDLSFWDAMISLLLQLTEAQLELGVSVVLDSVFMKNDRLHAQEMARKHGSSFRPIHTFVSNESVWEQRVTERFDRSGPEEGVADWERILEQRKHFLEWQSETALFVDAVDPLDQNYAAVLKYITSAEVDIKPLVVVTPLTRGSYHH